jgi:hypothetical protein
MTSFNREPTATAGDCIAFEIEARIGTVAWFQLGGHRWLAVKRRGGKGDESFVRAKKSAQEKTSR